MNALQDYHCDFHGVGIRISGSRNVISALNSRLGQLSPTTVDDQPLSFEFYSAHSISGHRIEKPPGAGRPFYNSMAGEATFFPAEDVIYMDYGGRARVLCKPSVGHCSISLLDPETEQLWLATHPLFTIPLIEMLKRRGRFNLHAAAFAQDGQCVLLPGTTGAGKSTLSIGLLRAGLDFLGDDMVFLRQLDGLRVLAFAEEIDVTDTTISFFKELREVVDRDQRAGWRKHGIDVNQFHSSRIVPSAAPKAMVFPCISNVAESTLSPITIEEAFMELVPSVLLTDHDSTQAHFQVLARLANTAPSYRLSTGRDFERIAGLLRELLR